MKRITMEIPDDVNIDLSEVLQRATALKMETIGDGKPAKRHVHRGEKTARQLVMSHFQTAGSFSREDARRWLMEDGFNESTASPTLSRLVKEHHLQDLGDGKFKFLKELK